MFGQKRNESHQRDFFLGDMEAQNSAQVRSAEAEETKEPKTEKPRFDPKQFLTEKKEQGKSALSKVKDSALKAKDATLKAKDSALKAKEDWSTAAKEKAKDLQGKLQQRREENARAGEAPRSRAASTSDQSIFSTLEYTARIINGVSA